MRYFELLQLPIQFRPDLQKVQANYFKLIRLLHPDQYVGGTETESQVAHQLSAEVNEAYRVLSDPDDCMEYILKNTGYLKEGGETEFKLPPAFLMQMMEWNEALEDASTPEKYQSVAQQLQALLKLWDDELHPTLIQSPPPLDQPDVMQKILIYYQKRHFVLRMLGRKNEL